MRGRVLVLLGAALGRLHEVLRDGHSGVAVKAGRDMSGAQGDFVNVHDLGKVVPRNAMGRPPKVRQKHSGRVRRQGEDARVHFDPTGYAQHRRTLWKGGRHVTRRAVAAGEDQEVQRAHSRDR